MRKSDAKIGVMVDIIIASSNGGEKLATNQLTRQGKFENDM